MIKSRIRGGQGVSRRLREIQQRLSDQKRVYVGLPEGSGNSEDGTPLVVIGAVNEFGGTINHPGGTKYGYRNQQEAEDGKVRFLKDGQGFMVLGETGPHKITIPERSFLRVPLRANQKEFANAFRQIMPKVARGELTIEQALNQIGAKAASVSQEAIAAGIAPANAPSTVRQKGSSKPLIDKGHLRQAITWVIKNPKELT